MSNRRKSGHEKRRMASGHSGPPFPLGSFNQMARQSCDNCGSQVEWLTGPEAEKRGIALGGAMQFLGVDAVPGRDVWACTNCDNYGVMGPAEGEWF